MLGFLLLPSSHSPMLAQTVASVGPYAFTILLPIDHLSTISPLHASPAATTVSNSSSSFGSSIASTVGGKVTVVIPSSLSVFVRPSPGIKLSRAYTYRLPPDVKLQKT